MADTGPISLDDHRNFEVIANLVPDISIPLYFGALMTEGLFETK